MVTMLISEIIIKLVMILEFFFKKKINNGDVISLLYIFF